MNAVGQPITKASRLEFKVDSESQLQDRAPELCNLQLDCRRYTITGRYRRQDRDAHLLHNGICMIPTRSAEIYISKQTFQS